MGILVSLFAATLLTAVGMSLVLLGSAETTLAAHDAQAQAATHAALGAIALAESELRAMPDWSGVLSAGAIADVCATPGRFSDASLQPRSPWDGSPLDLQALTIRLQAGSDAATPPGVTAPVWRLFDYGPISRLIPLDARAPPFYLVTWVADGRNGLAVLHAAALGPGGLVTAVEAVVGRQPDAASLMRLSLRPAP